MSDASTQEIDIHSVSKRYFALPRMYAEALGRLRWSEKDDGLTAYDGKPLASYENLAQFLEGFATQRSLLAFGSMAHWAVLLKIASEDGLLSRLQSTFATTGENWRNAGALAGMISESLPAAADPPDPAVLCVRLRDTVFPIRWYTGTLHPIASAGEEPAHSLVEFELHVRGALLSLTDADLSMWLQVGRGPLVRPGQDLARVQPPPRVLGSVFDELFNRPRLAGAAAYVPQMVLALSVPPRRQSPEQLPIGGYADLVTHGSVDRLLPSQHALDELEFLRRFCQNELLYFRREEPPASCRQEVVVVLDQGVRTWGDVRLVLTAAALSLVQIADRKALVHHLAFTSQPQIFVNPLDDPNQELGAALEASDFTRHPGLALESVLEWPSSVPRDIFLLTHPFSLLETDVQSAARRLLPRDRLFALTVSAQGDAELVQLRHGLPVRMKSFHVDFVAAPMPAPAPVESAPAWSGAVEKVGWPFRFGTDSPIHLFAFDYSGVRLLAVTKRSMLYAWNLADRAIEILPRPQTQRGRVTTCHAIEGVAGGFALLGSQDAYYVICHYDWLKRKCTVHATPLPTTIAVGLTYVRHLHAVVLFLHPTQLPLLAIDLETSARAHANQQSLGTPRYEVSVGKEPKEVAGNRSRRVEEAMRHVRVAGPISEVVSPVGVPVHAPPKAMKPANRKGPFYAVGSDGSLTITNDANAWQKFVPQTEGKNTLAQVALGDVRIAGNTLALQYVKPLPVYAHGVAFFRGPDGHFLREITWNSPTLEPCAFHLAHDGKKMTLLRDHRHIEVQCTDRPERILLTRSGGFGTVSRLWVGDNGLLLRCGRKGYSWHLLVWPKDHLKIYSQMGRLSQKLSHHDFAHPQIHDFARDQRLEEVTAAGAALLDDPERWPLGLERNGALFMLDRFGQVLIFDRSRKVVFQFFAHGDSWSAWMPDGTRHGLGSMHSWPNTSGALAAMGQALRRATGGQRP